MDPLLLDEPGDAPGDDRGLARSRPGQDEQGPLRMAHGFPLGGVQVGEERVVGRIRGEAGHPSILPGFHPGGAPATAPPRLPLGWTCAPVAEWQTHRT